MLFLNHILILILIFLPPRPIPEVQRCVKGLFILYALADWKRVQDTRNKNSSGHLKVHAMRSTIAASQERTTYPTNLYHARGQLLVWRSLIALI